MRRGGVGTLPRDGTKRRMGRRRSAWIGRAGDGADMHLNGGRPAQSYRGSGEGIFGEIAVVMCGKCVDTLGLKCEPNISVGESIPVRASPIFAAVPERAENPGGPTEELALLRDQRVGELGEPTRVEDI